MNPIIRKIKKVVKDNNIHDYLIDYPWLTGHIGNPKYKIWFVGENPSLQSVEDVHKRHKPSERTENLQWNSHDGDRLFREALTKAGLKSGDPDRNKGWKCYITNVIKEPEKVKDRNKKEKDFRYWKKQALIWLPVLQFQIDCGNPSVMVAIGNTAYKILNYMKSEGLKCPDLDLIPHYSYIMFRPGRAGLGPRHPIRIREFKKSIARIKRKYS